MHAEIEDFKTGWYGLAIGLREEDIDVLIERLSDLRESKYQHFHAGRKGHLGAKGGIADIEFYVQESGPDDMSFTGGPIPPNC